MIREDGTGPDKGVRVVDPKRAKSHRPDLEDGVDVFPPPFARDVGDIGGIGGMAALIATGDTTEREGLRAWPAARTPGSRATPHPGIRLLPPDMPR